MTIVTVHEAKTHLSRLLAAVEQGEDVVVARGTRPIARLVAVDGPDRPKRKLGRLRGRGTVADPHWAAEEVQALVEGA
jgi:prevent-host-death family protein